MGILTFAKFDFPSTGVVVVRRKFGVVHSRKYLEISVKIHRKFEYIPERGIVVRATWASLLFPGRWWVYLWSNMLVKLFVNISGAQNTILPRHPLVSSVKFSGNSLKIPVKFRENSMKIHIFFESVPMYIVYLIDYVTRNSSHHVLHLMSIVRKSTSSTTRHLQRIMTSR